MPFARPTLTDLITQTQQDFVSRLKLAGALLRKSLAYVTSRVVAGAVHMLHGHLAYISKQVSPYTADEANLMRIGSQRNVTREPAAFATGSVAITGTNGTVIPANTVFLRTDGVEYTVDADGTITGGTVTVSVTAAVADKASNCDAGVVLSFQSSITGASDPATVGTGGLSGGTDVEDLEAYRSRVIADWQNPPQGGAEPDYEAWARLVPGVTRVWVTPKELGVGTVVVRFVRDNDPGSVIPDSGEVAAVQSVLTANAPVTATVTAIAPIDAPLAFSIHLSPDTTAIRAEVSAELADLIQREAAPSGTLPLDHIRTAVGEGVVNAGGSSATYTMSSPSADVVSSTGHLTSLGNITWT